jgi:hypothetical protein
MGATLPGGVKLAGLSHHLIDLGDMLLLEGDLFPGVFFKPHALVHDEREQLVVLRIWVMSCLWDSTSVPILREGCPPSDVTCSPAMAAWFMPSVAWLRIQLMIGMRAWPKTIRE